VADILGVSDDLVYELVARGEIPCLRLGRRRLIPRRVVELMVERSIETFEASTVMIPFLRGASEPD
jgi:excisionase family DNA binding protein